MGVNKVMYGSRTVIDISGDTVTPDKLLSGVIGHNASGERIIGTYESSGSSGGKNVAQGTIAGAGSEAVTIDTGLTSVSKIIIFRSGSGESGILTLAYIDGRVTSVGVSYGQYISTVSYSVGELAVNGGNVTYTPKSGTTTSNLMQDKEYTWIAIE